MTYTKVNEMRRLILMLLLISCSEFVFAGQGGGHHKVTAYDYHDYVNSNIQSKMFARHQNDGVLYNEVWNFERPNLGEVVRTQIATDAGGSVFRCIVNKFEATTEMFKWVQSNRCDGSIPPVVISMTEYIPPIPVFTNAMVPGIAWGDAGVIQSTFSLENYYTDVSEIVGVEDVTVPAGTFSDCLKIYRQRGFSNFIPRIAWVCPNMGLVKSVNSNNRLMELTDVTFDN